MKILNIPEITIPPAEHVAGPAPDDGRVHQLESAAKALHARLHDLEIRIADLEAAQKTSSPMDLPVPAGDDVLKSFPTVTLDAEAVKKGLLVKMWKYLNDDERPAKAV